MEVGPAATVLTPPPCVATTPAPSVEETKARFDKFAHAFLVTKTLTEAFESLAASYRVSGFHHCPIDWMLRIEIAR